MLFPKSLPLFFVIVLVLVTAAGCAPLLASSSAQPAAGLVPQTATAAPASTTMTGGLRPIAVTDVTVQVGVGSPIPVDAVVSGGWPELCAQLAQVTQRFEGRNFDISLLATAADPACPPDYVGLPFRMAIPINVVQLPAGAYTVTVNGAKTTFSVPVTSPGGEPPAGDTTPGAPATPPATPAR